MKLPKSIGLLLIFGLLLHAMTPTGTSAFESLENPPSPLRPGSTDNLMSSSGGEQNIDPFTVNPINRWDSSSSGPLTTSIENGELSLETYINDSSESYYFRESSTADDTIAIRWRLNQTADDNPGTNTTDWFIENAARYGIDGCSWQENALETGQIDGLGGGAATTFTYTNGYMKADVTGDTATYAKSTLLDFDVTGLGSFDNLSIRWKANGVGLRINIEDQDHLEITSWITAAAADTWQTDTLVIDHTYWTDTDDGILLFFNEKSGEGNLDGDEDFYVDSINIWWDSEYQGDFAIPLCGLNATTSEGTANTTLTAYQWNSTHYVIRPTFTTEDGTLSRSWNMDSNYQDNYQMFGIKGSDGIDYTEGKDGSGAVGTTVSASLGTLNATTIADGNFKGVRFIDEYLQSSEYSYYELKIRALGETTHIKLSRSGFGYSPAVEITDNWQSYLIDVPESWKEECANMIVYIYNGSWPASSAGDGVLIDFFRLTTTNDTSDLTFFEFNEYYRAELDYDLRSSQLEFELQDDLGDDVSKEEIGDFSISNYFDTDDLIPDVFQAEVGHIDYLLGLRTAGSNGTAWWDYYQAEFAEFTWKHTWTELDGGTGPWDGVGPYACHAKADGIAVGSTKSRFELVVPEFDAASGRIVIDEPNYPGAVLGRVFFYIYSVDAQTGTRHLEAYFQVHPLAVGTAYIMRAFYNISGTQVNITDMQIDNGKTGWGEVTFSIHFDKQNDLFSLQISGKDSSSKERRASTTWPMVGDSNEVVFVTQFDAVTVGQIGAEVVISLEDWSLTFRDIFGIPIDLPSVDDVLGGIFGFLGNILAALMTPIGLGLKAIAKTLESLQGILSELQSIARDVANLSSILSAVQNIPDMVTDVGKIIDDWTDITNWLGFIEDIWGIIETIVADIAATIWTVITDGLTILLDAVVLILGDITDAGVNFIRGIGVGGTTIGDVLDVVGEILALFVVTIGDTIQFILMILTEWAPILMVLIFVGILFFAVASSDQPGQVFGNIWKPLSTNIMPISIWGFKIHIPLVVLVIPFIFIVILGIV